MTDATHLLYDAAQHAVVEAEARVAELRAHVAAQDAVKMQATFNRIVMADGSLADAGMYLAEARRRAMQEQARASAAPDAQTFDREA